MAFLEDSVDRDQGLERLDLVGENGLARSNQLASAKGNSLVNTYTLIPAQKACEDL
jgi:hypothetical protein